jgi:hypothetical protein
MYKRKYKNIPLIDLLLRHIEMFKNISFLVVVLLNIIILVDVNEIQGASLDSYFSLYDKIMLFQLVISFCLLVFFALKEMPLVVLETNRTLEKRKMEYGSNYATYPRVIQ